MPEGDTIFRAARTLNKALAGKKVTRFESVLPHLSRVDVDSPIAGRTIESVSSIGKWNLMRFSGDLALVTHMRMNGSWHVYRRGDPWKKSRRDMRILIETTDFIAVAFNVPVAEFHTELSLARHPVISKLGPDVLGAGFDVEEAAQRIRRYDTAEIGVVILNQRVMAGLGNVFRSEVLFASGINPFACVASLSDAALACLVGTAQRFLQMNTQDWQQKAQDGDLARFVYAGFRRTTGYADPSARLWVYGRRGKPCRKCGTPIVHGKQGLEARGTYWCPQCQPGSGRAR